MYQGKFDAKRLGHESPEENLQRILDERKAAQEAEQRAKAARAARQAAAARQQAASGKSGSAPRNPAKPTSSVPAAKSAPKARTTSSKAEPQSSPKAGNVIFYTVYALIIVLFIGGTLFTLRWLRGWLEDYELAQPAPKSQEVFDEYFANPDWAQLYSMAKTESTVYEGSEQYVAYMKEHAAGKEIDYVETSAGLSLDTVKYIVRLDGEKIATFTLEDTSGSRTSIPDWNLGTVELFFHRQQGYLIQKLDGHTAYVNGVALDDSFTIQIASTKAEDFLPIGVSGVRTCIQSISGLMALPEVKVYNQTGEELPVIYDEATGTFIEQTAENTMPDEEREVTINALRAQAEFMINAAGARANVAKYYDGSSRVYSEITEMAKELWMNHDYGHRFLNEQIDGYCKYSSDLFAVHCSMTMNVTYADGNTGNFDIAQSLFFTKKNGKWVCYEKTNEDVFEPVGEVRLTFMNKDEELYSSFFETNAIAIQTPVVSAPEGKKFSGWVREDYDESGHKKLTLVFVPDEAGAVTITGGTVLEPMTLYALFENAESEEGGN